MLDEIRKRFGKGGLKAVWRWAMEPKRPLGKAKRFEACATFARKHKQNAKGAEAKLWEERQRSYHAESRRYFKQHKRRKDVKWPDSVPITELLYHDPPHFHCASSDRKKLIELAKIGQEKYRCRIGEFPPFDTVENVHVSGSWHYRDSSNPWVRRDFGNRGDGLAFDANDLDGGNDEEFAFYSEVRERYL